MSKIDRRKFFAGMGTGLLGVGLGKGNMRGPMPDANLTNDQSEEPKIIKYNKLGNTGLKTSDVIFGAGSFAFPNIAKYAYDLGVNVFDTAESYMRGRSEEHLSKALKGIRDKSVIISKHYCGETKVEPNTSKENLIKRVDESLKRLKTDYIDILFIHSVSSIDVVKHEGLQAGYEQLKKDGKVRFTGFSTHNAKVMLKDCLDPSLKDFVQVVLFMYNHMEGKEIEPLIAKVRAKGIGTISMKNLAGGKQGSLKSFVKSNISYPQAAIGWVLANKNVDCAVMSMKSYSHVDEYVGASGKVLQRDDLVTLKNYQKEVDKEYCRVTCNKCEGACPDDVAISDIMRYEMYYKDYGHEKVAVDNYNQLDKKKKPTSCKSCIAYCEKACPHELNVKERLLQTDKILSV